MVQFTWGHSFLFYQHGWTYYLKCDRSKHVIKPMKHLYIYMNRITHLVVEVKLNVSTCYRQVVPTCEKITLMVDGWLLVRQMKAATTFNFKCLPLIHQNSQWVSLWNDWPYGSIYFNDDVVENFPLYFFSVVELWCDEKQKVSALVLLY